MATITIEDIHPWHLRELAQDLRRGDLNEITCAGLRPLQALWRAYRNSVYSRAGLVDGKVAAAWGVTGTIISPSASLWLLTGSACSDIPLSFVKIGRAELLKMLEFYHQLEGLVHPEYHQAIKFLRLLGFHFVEANGPFLKFRMER